MRRTLVVCCTLWVVLFALLIYYTTPEAGANWIEVDTLAIDFMQYFPDGRTPLITSNGLPDREPGQRLGVDINMNSLGFLYWQNRVESMTDRGRDGQVGQFRSIGWQLELGATLLPLVDTYYYHHSQHVMDHEYKPGFPCEDGVGFRLKLIGGRK